MINYSIHSSLVSQTIFAQLNAGTTSSKLTAFTHANLMIALEKRLSDATLLIENNRIKAILGHNDIPAGAFKIDVSSDTVYPGFI